MLARLDAVARNATDFFSGNGKRQHSSDGALTWGNKFRF